MLRSFPQRFPRAGLVLALAAVISLHQDSRSSAESVPAFLLEHVNRSNGPGGANLPLSRVEAIRRPPLATPAGRHWLLITIGPDLTSPFDNIRASCYNYERIPAVRTLSIAFARNEDPSKEIPGNRMWTLTQILECRADEAGLRAEYERGRSAGAPESDVDFASAWRALHAVLLIMDGDSQWELFETKAVNAQMDESQRGRLTVELTMQSSVDVPVKFTDSLVERLKTSLEGTANVVATRYNDPTNRRPRMRLRIELDWSPKHPAIATEIANGIVSVFPPPAYSYERKGQGHPDLRPPKSEEGAASRPTGK